VGYGRGEGRFGEERIGEGGGVGKEGGWVNGG